MTEDEQIQSFINGLERQQTRFEQIKQEAEKARLNSNGDVDADLIADEINKLYS